MEVRTYMVKPRMLILRVGGTNCDLETEWAFRLAGALPERIHLNMLKSGEKKLDNYQALVIPGGFSYGDDISAGKVLANKIRYGIKEEITSFIGKGRPVLGICNGFQVLIKSGFLPWPGRQEATLAWNESARFEDRWVYLKVEDSVSPFFKGMRGIIRLPVAHAEGRFLVREPKILERIESKKLVLMRYCDSSGKHAGYPGNPNGSAGDIAGICDPSGLIVGMMPHPERALLDFFCPDSRGRGKKGGEGDGYSFFKNVVDYFR